MKNILRKVMPFCLIICMALSLFAVTPVLAAKSQGKTKVQKINLENKNITLTVGSKDTLKATVKPVALSKKIKWKTSNNKIVTVSKKGKLNAKKTGKAKISAYIGKKTASCWVTVIPNAKKITLNKKNISLTVSSKSTLKATVKPTKLAKHLKWKTSDKKTVTVSKKGELNAKKTGKAKVTAYIGKKTASCWVTVSKKTTPLPTEQTFTVSFNLNYDNPVNAPPAQKVITGKTATEPVKRIRSGYVFDGWYKEKSCVSLFVFNTEKITSNITLYAKWMEYNEDESIVQLAYNQLSIGYGEGDYEGSVIQNVSLISSLEEASITWDSSIPDIVSNTGVVNRPLGLNTSVTLTAEIKKGTALLKKTFELVVIRENDRDASEIHNNSVIDIQNMNTENENFQIEYNDDNSQVTSINGVFSDVIIESVEDARQSIYSVYSILGLNKPEDITWAATNHDEFGVGYTFNQMYNGLEVYGRKITVTVDTNGETDSLSSGVLDVDKLPRNTTASLSKEDAETCVKSSVDGELRLTYLRTVIYSLGDYEDNSVLAYEIHVAGTDSYGDNIDENVIIDANTGLIIFRDSNIFEDRSITGHGKNEQNVDINFPIEFKSWDWYFYYMMDTSRKITMYKGHLLLPDTRIGSELNWWTDKTAISAYTNTITVYDWWKNNLNRNSVDNNSLPLKVAVHSNGKDNAFWNGSDKSINFCDNSSGSGVTTAGALDVIAHEFTHGVVQFTTGGLPYSNATGAINEGYADIFGCFVDGNWTMGENWKVIRNVANPSATGNPSRLFEDNYQDYTTDSSDNGGVHHNATIVSHAAYLMSTYGLTGSKLHKLWYGSLSMGYDATSDFYTVRRNVLKQANRQGLSQSDIAIIKKAFNDVNIMGDAGTLSCMVTDVSTNVSIANATVSAYQANILIKSETTDANGCVSLPLEIGTYRIEISAGEYVTFTGNVEITKDFVTEKSIGMVKNGNGTVLGTITSATTGNPLGDVTLNVRDGWDTIVGTVVKTVETAENGTYSFTLNAGYYTIEMQKSEYSTGYINVTVMGDVTVANQNGSISPYMAGSQFRVVLTWGSNPQDLDSHLVGNLADGSSYHIAYNNKNGYNAEYERVANLDVDDTNGYGPETVTFTVDVGSTYEYYVHWYSGYGTWGTSEAKVELYNGDNLIAVYNVPMGNTSSGGRWNVFKLSRGILTTTNTIE